jgi:hypothetical protein
MAYLLQKRAECLLGTHIPFTVGSFSLIFGVEAGITVAKLSPIWRPRLISNKRQQQLWFWNANLAAVNSTIRATTITRITSSSSSSSSNSKEGNLLLAAATEIPTAQLQQQQNKKQLLGTISSERGPTFFGTSVLQPLL